MNNVDIYSEVRDQHTVIPSVNNTTHSPCCIDKTDTSHAQGSPPSKHSSRGRQTVTSEFRPRGKGNKQEVNVDPPY